MPNLTAFDDFFTDATGPAYFTDPNKVINDAQLRNYELVDRLTRDRAAESIQGGNQIQAPLFGSDPLTADTYGPGDAVTVLNVKGLDTINSPWRFMRGYMTWNDAETVLNGSSQMTSDAQFQQYVNIKNFKYQQGLTSLMNKVERLMVAAPTLANQQNGKDPYSLQYSITDDGLAPVGFSNLVHGLNATDNTFWRNQNVNWTSGQAFDDTNGIIAAFDQMALLVRWKRPATFSQYFEDSDMYRHVITTNREGRYTYSQALRASNDVTRAGAQNPAYNDPVYDGVPIVPVEAFDDQSSFTAAQPQYFWKNLNYFKFIFHADRFFEKSEVMKFADKPDTSVVYVVLWGNLLNCSRQRSGHVGVS